MLRAFCHTKINCNFTSTTVGGISELIVGVYAGGILVKVLGFFSHIVHAPHSMEQEICGAFGKIRASGRINGNWTSKMQVWWADGAFKLIHHFCTAFTTRVAKLVSFSEVGGCLVASWKESLWLIFTVVLLLTKQQKKKIIHGSPTLIRVASWKKWISKSTHEVQWTNLRHHGKIVQWKQRRREMET